MKKTFLTLIALLAMQLIPNAYAGTITIANQYPSPSGIYNWLQLTATDSPPDCSTPNHIGRFYFDLSEVKMKYCTGSLPWESFSSPWTQTGTNVHLVDPNNKVGIGTSTPLFKLSLAQDGGILSEGILNTGTSLGDLPGNLSRFVWYPRKAALRAGWVQGTGSAWHAANIGDYSVAMGYNTLASGRDAFAMGYGNIASGQDASAVGGTGNTASGIYSFIAGGQSNTASAFNTFIGSGSLNQAIGTISAILGGNNNVTNGVAAAVTGGAFNQNFGHRSTISGGLQNFLYLDNSNIGGGSDNYIGDNTMTNDPVKKYAVIGGGRGNYSMNSASTVAGGSDNTASEDRSTVGGGGQNQATGVASTVAGGAQNQATAQASTVAGGNLNHATGVNATVAGGLQNIASGSNSIIPGGSNNNVAGDASLAAGKNMVLGSAADRTFIWGHSGSAIPAITTADAFIIYSGNVGIGTTTPQQKLHIAGAVRLEPQDNPPVCDDARMGTLYVYVDGGLCFCSPGPVWDHLNSQGNCP